MLAMIVLLLLALIFAIVAMLWGYDSRDRIDSPEWERRAQLALFQRHPIPHTPKPTRGKAVYASSSRLNGGRAIRVQPAAGTLFRRMTHAL